jgi:hypothetical protein
MPDAPDDATRPLFSKDLFLLRAGADTRAVARAPFRLHISLTRRVDLEPVMAAAVSRNRRGLLAHRGLRPATL